MYHLEPDKKVGELVAVEPEHQKIQFVAGAAEQYLPKYAQALVDWFNQPIQYWHEVLDDQENVIGKVQKTTILPMMARFACSIGVSLRTIERWATAKRPDDAEKNLYPDFAEAYQIAIDLQEALLVEGGLMGLYSDRMTPFILKNKHGYKDKIETINTNTHAYPNDSELEALYAQGAKAAAEQAETYRYKSGPDTE